MQNTLPRIKDVARLAGVSTATVSRALSKPETVTEDTRRIVLEAASKTGYRVNRAARNLRRRQTGALVVLVPDLGNPFFSEILAGIEAEASRADLNVLVVDTAQAPSKKETVINYLHNNRADGIVVLDGGIPLDVLSETRSTSGGPPVVFACEWAGEDEYPSVRADNIDGAVQAIAHLVALGHRKIGHILGPPDNVLTDARLRGMRLELRAHGLDLPDEWIFAGDFTLDSGAGAADQWLALNDPPSAMFCSSDQMAIGFISQLTHKGVSVPRDVSVIGFDDVDIARWFVPGLTTIHQPRKELGIAAAASAIGRIKGAAGGPVVDNTTLPVELIARASTAAYSD